MNVLSLFSGVGGFDLGLERAGMVEGETRSGLFYEAIRIIKELQDERRGPAWVVWENVVGALSSNGGRDFGAVLDSLADLGAVDIQWRVLDAQWFGVPQRRRRVFVVARLDPGAAGRPEVLPVGASVRRDSSPSSEAGPVVAALTANGVGAGGGPDDNAAQAGHLTPVMAFGWQENQTAGTVWQDEVPGLTTTKTYAVAFSVKDDGGDAGSVAPTLRAGSHNQSHANGGVPPAVAIAENQHGEVRTSDVSPSVSSGVGKPGQGYPAVLEGGSLAVRRLTPRECERLMGWPDDWTRYADDGSEIADSHRYRMCGNGVVANVAEWIGRRIVEADQ